MTALDSVNALRVNILAANDLIAQLKAGKEKWDVDLRGVAALDKTKLYFGINEDGTASIIGFDANTGQPDFHMAEPLPVDATLPDPPEAPAAEAPAQ